MRRLRGSNHPVLHTKRILCSVRVMLKLASKFLDRLIKSFPLLRVPD